MSAYAVCIFLSAYIRTVCSVAGIVQENGLNSLSKTPFVFRYRMIRLISIKMCHRTVLNKTVLKRTFNCNHTHKKRFVKNNMKNRLLISDRSAYIFRSGYIPNYSDSHRLSHLYRTTRCQALLNFRIWYR